MYSLKLYKYRDSYVLYTPTVQLFGSLLHTHTLLVQTHTHDVSAPWVGLIFWLGNELEPKIPAKLGFQGAC